MCGNTEDSYNWGDIKNNGLSIYELYSYLFFGLLIYSVEKVLEAYVYLIIEVTEILTRIIRTLRGRGVFKVEED
ncbi:hypothetical protein LCGC14_2204920 [marine sediment metagenome]|uniref:Uncharacterized protein n=1 Tax=marine sediment metagenome TaxID=412755 RepID=A0A0F9DFI2_9ZZZZ